VNSNSPTQLSNRALRWFPVNLVFEMVFFFGHLLEDGKREREKKRRIGSNRAREVITV
jgi:hypothetical protein